ncbi:Histidine transport ATP-binding protein HisP [Raoultella terrigena]|uniref:Histidine transport ATP-binding protein HisP n=1 Tax=Raoultella terrigena TaxID=577 RepID=A0A4U9CT50_RAOTE|nr:Histidine transport ATP-binding protein HisP [Raoultella terrigena]
MGEVLTLIQDIAANGQTMIIVTHEMEFARQVASRVVFMEMARSWSRGRLSRFLGGVAHADAGVSGPITFPRLRSTR